MTVNYWLIIGILIIVIGFAMKFDSLAVVLFAAVVTALIGGLDFITILETLGSKFVGARVSSLFILTLPIVGVCERYGLKEQAVKLIQKLKVLTAGRVIIVYQLIREIAAAGSLRLGGHPQFVRPLIEPMAEGAAIQQKNGEALSDEELDLIKSGSAAADNYGNFFAQNVFAASAGVQLIVQTLTAAGFAVTLSQIALWSIPIAVIAFVLGVVQALLLDHKLTGGKRHAK